MTQSDFIAIINPLRSKMFRFAKRLLISNEEAEDATQEVIMKLWAMNERLNEYRSIEALAMTMTKNYCLDQLKSNRATKHLQIVHNDFAIHGKDYQKDLESSDSLKWIGRIVNQLPEQQKLVLHMRDIEHYEFAQIAEILDITEVTARVTLNRARKTIKEQIIKTHQYGTA
ncbi:RNA polymerase sigma factor [Flavobacterium pallidum]|uniref:RNA polymerase subunit sigma-70 n=1 Tax=Flavobacterium pallidum TaxID=2172098 RepID=A0A2S1SHD4_9FLAO|nr:sigma-70 family RNA polymerase sigma factor [Flavobacterium pallidum]AWI25824.1 RNA polymerase subunit sigma-70 [Flavobacterium pallidum]